jgi:hypothetical protein
MTTVNTGVDESSTPLVSAISPILLCIEPAHGKAVPISRGPSERKEGVVNVSMERDDARNLAVVERICTFAESKYCDSSDSPLVVPPATYKRIIASFKTWLLVFHIYGFRFYDHAFSKLCLPFDGRVKECALLLSRGVGVLEYFKYMNSSFFVEWEPEQVLPAAPSWLGRTRGSKYLFGGVYYMFQRIIHFNATTDRSFRLTILNTKRAMPFPVEEEIEIAERKNELLMTTEKPQAQPVVVDLPVLHAYHARVGVQIKVRDFDPWLDGPLRDPVLSARITTDDFKGQIDRTIREVYAKFDPSLDVLTSIYLPSPGANSSYDRTNCGCYAALANAPCWTDFRERSRGTIKLRAKLCKLQGFVSDIYGPAGITEEFELALSHFEKVGMGVEVDVKVFLREWRRFYWQLFKLAQAESPHVYVVGLAEALKIRIISKGPPLTYFCLKKIQLLMWKQLQKFWNFELTGTPITLALMNERFGSFNPELERMHSGDYRAATDEIHSWTSEQVSTSFFQIWEENIVDPMLKGLPGIYKPLFDRSLTQHQYLIKESDCPEERKAEAVGHKDSKGVRYLVFPQKRGQLMGSIISFPVLCLVNITLMRLSYELSHGCKVSLRNLPCWVNGDDCLTRYSSPLFPSVWTALGTFIGLENSVGKTYDSKIMCSINSMYFEWNKTEWTIVPYVNMGLAFTAAPTKVIWDPSETLTPEKIRRIERELKKEERRFSQHLFQLGKLHRTMLETAGPYRQKAHSLFMYRHSNSLKQTKLSWFLPVWLGGLGLLHNSETNDFSYQDLVRVRGRLALISEGAKKLTGVDMEKSAYIHYDLFSNTIREVNPFITDYYYQHYVDMSDQEVEGTYGTAFSSLIYAHWLKANCLDVLLRQNNGPNQLTLFERAFNASLVKGEKVIGIGRVKKFKSPRWMDMICSDEVKTTVFPVWCSKEV